MMPPTMGGALDARRKRKREQDKPRSPKSPVAHHHVAETKDTSALLHDEEQKETQPPRVAEATPTASTVEPPHEYRGRCLYQSRKCENERALKRNGKAHNLCEEHRNKQNQHQRKFDLKKHARAGESGGEESDKPPPTNEDTSTTPTQAEPPAKAENKKEKRSPKPTRDPEPPRQPQRYRRTTHLRRPPPLQTQSTPVSQEPVDTLSELRAASLLLPTPVMPDHYHQHHVGPPQYSSLRTPVAGYGHQHHHLPHPESMAPRSHSFDSGVSRISPVGGVSYPYGFDRPRHLSEDHVHEYPTTTAPLPSIARPGKLPSLRELPLAAKLNQRSPPRHLPSDAGYYPDERRSPPAYTVPPVYSTYAVDPRTTYTRASPPPPPPSPPHHPGRPYDGYYPPPPPPFRPPY